MAEAKKNSWDAIGTVDEEAPQGPIVEEGYTIGEPQAKPLNKKEEAETRVLELAETRGGMDPKEFAKWAAQRAQIPRVIDQLNEIETLYKKTLKGKRGSLFGFGGAVNPKGYLPKALAPDIDNFNNANKALMNPVIPMEGTTAGQVNQPSELQIRFGPYVADGSDPDVSIEGKLERMKREAIGAARKSDAEARHMGFLEPDEPGYDTTRSLPWNLKPAEGWESSMEGVKVPPLPEGPAGPGGDQQPPDVNAPGPLVRPAGEGGDKVTKSTNLSEYGEVPEKGPGIAGEGGADFKIVRNPQMAGANDAIREMWASGNPSEEDIVKYLQDRGYTSPESLAGIRRDYKAVSDYRKTHKGFVPKVEVETIKVPTKWQEKVTGSDFGAGAAAAVDTATGGHLENIAGMAGRDPEEFGNQLGALRAEHPTASLVGDVAGGGSSYLMGGGVLRGVGALGRGAGILRTGELLSEAPALAAEEGSLGAAAERQALSAAQENWTTTGLAQQQALREATPNAMRAFSKEAIGGDVLHGGYTASGQGGTDLFNPEATAMGAVSGLAGIPVRGGFNTAGAALSPTGGRLGPLLEAGGTTSVGQRLAASDSVIGKVIGGLDKFVSQFPGLGQPQKWSRKVSWDDMQKATINDSLGDLAPFEALGLKGISTLPDKIKKGAGAINHLINAFDHAYDVARSGMSVTKDPGFKEAMDDFTTNQMHYLSADGEAIFNKAVAHFDKMLEAGKGRLSGDHYKRFVSDLAEAAGKQKDEYTGVALMNLRQMVDDAARRNSPQHYVDLLDAADHGYGKAMIILNAVEGADKTALEAGEFTGQGLYEQAFKADPSKRSKAWATGKAKGQKLATSARALGPPPSDEISTTGAVGAATLAGTTGATALTPWAAIPAGAYAISTAANTPGVRGVLNWFMTPHLAGSRTRAAGDAIRKGFERVSKMGGPMMVAGTAAHQDTEVPPEEQPPQ